MKKMYIAVLDEAPDYMVPTLVAHSMLGAHLYYTGSYRILPCDGQEYDDWLHNSFRKVVLRVNRKEFEKIESTLNCFYGYENTICNGEASCLVIHPIESDAVPNVLKFAKLWAPKEGK